MIRAAEEKDIERILQLLVQVNMVHHIDRPDLFKGPATKYNAEELAAIFKNPVTPVFVAVDENDAVEGYVFCVVKQVENDHLLCDIKTLYIDDLCVDEKFRGKHIGRKLYAYALDYAKRIGCYNLTLNVWSKNQSATKFYEQMGLTPQKTTMETIIQRNQKTDLLNAENKG